VTKNDMVIEIAKETGLRQVDIKRIVQLTLDGIIQVLASEGRIELRNFGVFEVKERKARKARNPRTGEEVDVPAKFVATFKPGKMMEEKILQIRQVQAKPPVPTA
jgi:integration host factor subunit beta